MINIIKINTSNKSDNNDKKLSSIVSMVFLFLFIINLSSGVSQINNIDINLLSIGLKIVLGLTILFRIRIVISRLDYFSLFILIVAMIIIIANYLFFPYLRDQFTIYVIDFLTIVLPLVLYLIAIRDYKYLHQSLLKVSKLISILAALFFIYFLFIQKINFNEGHYSMGLSYALLLPSIVLAKDYIDTKANKSLILSGILVSIIIAFGSRGPIVCFSTYLILKAFHEWRFVRKNYFKLILLVTILFLIPFSYKLIFSMINDFLESINIYSRALRALISDQIVYSGRDEIYISTWQYIKSNPLAIRGINSDILIIGGYVHNIFLELLFQLGVLGGIFILVILYRSFKTIFYRGNNSLYEYTLIMFSIALPMLMVSDSLWGNMYFWSWFFLSIKLYKVRNKLTKKEEVIAVSN